MDDKANDKASYILDFCITSAATRVLKSHSRIFSSSLKLALNAPQLKPNYHTKDLIVANCTVVDL